MATVLAVLLAGCGEGAAEPQPTTASSTPPPTAHQSASSNQRLFARAVRLLAQVGATGVAEAEPAHGSPAISLYGEWRGHEVLVGVVPTEQAAFDEPVAAQATWCATGRSGSSTPRRTPAHQVNIAQGPSGAWSCLTARR